MTSRITPAQDSGWGLIYRLNGLFSEVEILAPEGNYDKWNFKLDRIWSNLIYREDIEIVKDKQGNILDLKFSEEDIKVKQWFDKEINQIKKEISQAKKIDPEEAVATRNKKYRTAKNKLYDIIMKKEIWLRKFMYQLGLYLKESKHNPSGAMWGGD
jgi:uncharacterized protein YacL (UPF0231 family)